MGRKLKGKSRKQKGLKYSRRKLAEIKKQLPKKASKAKPSGTKRREARKAKQEEHAAAQKALGLDPIVESVMTPA